MTFSKIFENAGNREMGLSLDGEDLLHFRRLVLLMRISIFQDKYLGQAFCYKYLLWERL